MIIRTCVECGTALAEDASPRRVYCSTACRQRRGDRLRKRAKYRTDPDHRAQKLATAAERRADPVTGEQIRAAERDRYRSDPEYRQERLDHSRAQYRKDHP